jgi:hypothetical protein
MDNFEKLLGMPLHDRIDLSTYEILRVPGGWIYTKKWKSHCNGVGDQISISSTFVPEAKGK